MEKIVTQINEDSSISEYIFKGQRIIEYNYWDWKPFYCCMEGYKIEEKIIINRTNAVDTIIEIRSAIMPDNVIEYSIYCSGVDKEDLFDLPGKNHKGRGLNYKDARLQLLRHLLKTLNDFKYLRLERWKFVIEKLTIIIEDRGEQLTLF